MSWPQGGALALGSTGPAYALGILNDGRLLDARHSLDGALCYGTRE